MPADEPKKPIRWVRVYSSPTTAQAHLVRHALEQEGIPTDLRNEMLSTLGGAIPMVDAMPEVRVPVEAIEHARTILARIETSGESGRLSVTDQEGGELGFPQGGELSEGAEKNCPGCGEPNPADFGECWSCQRAFDD